MLNLAKLVKGYQDSARSVGELLPWTALWDEQTVITSDQGLMAAFTYEGIDAEGRSRVEVDNAVNAFEKAFSAFGSGSTIWTTVDRRKTDNYPSGRFIDKAAAYIETTWADRIKGGQYENKYSLAVYQRASDGALALFDTMDKMVKEEDISLHGAFLKAIQTRLSRKAKVSFDTRQVKTALEKLNNRVLDLDYNLSRLGLKRMRGEELMAYLHMRANPVSGGRKAVRVPSIPAFLNFYLANDAVERLPASLLFTDGVRKKYVGVISLKGWPDGETFPGNFDFLTAVQGEVTVCHAFRFIDREVAAKAIDNIEAYNITQSIPFFHRIISQFTNQPPSKFDHGRLALAEDAKAAKVELVANNRAFGYHNMTVLCYGDTPAEMEQVRLQVMQRLSESFFMGFGEKMHQLTAWTQTLPGQWGASVRWVQSSFGNVADIAPIRTLLPGSLLCKYFSAELRHGDLPALIGMPTDSGVPFNWDPFESGAGHTAFIGPTRSGKSVLVNFLMSLFKKYPGARVIKFDKDYSAKVPTLMLDGVHIDLTPDRTGDGTRMSPMALAADTKHHQFLIRWVRQILEIGRMGEPLNPDEIQTLTKAVHGMAELPKSMHRLSTVRTSLGQSLGVYLEEWIGEGSRAGWFDNEPSVVEIGDDICFEMKRLFDDESVAVLSLDYLFYLVEQSLDGRPLIVNVEETWFFLRNKTFVNRLDDFLRTIGKRNGALWITTQGANELTSNDQLQGMLEQLKNRVFLPNAAIINSRAGYEQLGLTEEQLWRIQGAEPKRDYYIKTETMTRMVNVRIPDELIPWFTASTRALQTIARHYAKRDPEGEWKLKYIEEMLGD